MLNEKEYDCSTKVQTTHWILAPLKDKLESSSPKSSTATHSNADRFEGAEQHPQMGIKEELQKTLEF